MNRNYFPTRRSYDLEKNGKIGSVTLKNTETGDITEHETDGAFVYIGMVPLSEPFIDLGIVEESEGYIPSNDNMETEIQGVYSAGDIRVKDLRQIVTARGDGSIADEQSQKFVEEVNERMKVSE